LILLNDELEVAYHFGVPSQSSHMSYFLCFSSGCAILWWNVVVWQFLIEGSWNALKYLS